MSKNYHLSFDPKLGHGFCAICHIPCACVSCVSILDKPWISDFHSVKQARYQLFTKWTYWPVLGSYNNCNIIELTPISTPFEAFDEIHKIVLDRLSENEDPLFQSGMYGAINTYDITTNAFFIIQFLSEVYTLTKNTITKGQVISAVY